MLADESITLEMHVPASFRNKARTPAAALPCLLSLPNYTSLQPSHCPVQFVAHVLRMDNLGLGSALGDKPFIPSQVSVGLASGLFCSL